jgi:hypothetical protein
MSPIEDSRIAGWCVVAAVMTLSGEAHAQAQSLEVRMSGWINRAILRADDGVADALFHVDNSNGSTRFRVNADGTIGSGLRAGALLEVESQSNPANQVNFATREVSARLLERHIDVYASGGWGLVRLGHGDGAATRAAEVDLSGTALALYPNPVIVGAAFAYRTSTEAPSEVTIRNSINNQNFEMRYSRIRYSTLSFAGLWGEASWGSKDNYVAEVALRYAGTLPRLGALAGAVGYSNEQGTAGAMDDKVLGGSVSWLHAVGINLTYGQARRGLRDRDAEFRHFKLGYRWSRHAAAIDYAEGVDQAALGDEAKMVGVGYVYSPVGWAQFYAMWKRHMLERPADSFQPIHFYMMGTRLVF